MRGDMDEFENSDTQKLLDLGAEIAGTVSGAAAGFFVPGLVGVARRGGCSADARRLLQEAWS
jgi:hypothetical protein